MNSPESLTLIRHGESNFNSIRKAREQDPLYRSFLEAYTAIPDSDLTRRLAIELRDMFPVKFGDHETPLTESAGQQISDMAEKLKRIIAPPDVIFSSPYLRTLATLELMIKGWPELGNTKTIIDERLRERDHGLSLLYYDWRIFAALNPEQRELREMQGKYWYRIPNGENMPDLRLRTDSWLSSLNINHAGEDVMGLTHYLPLLAVMASVMEFDTAEFERYDREDEPINAGVTIFHSVPHEEGQRLALKNYNMKLY